MWRILRERLDTGASSTGRQALYQAFTSLRPTPGKLELSRVRNEIAGTDKAVPDISFRTHTYNTIWGEGDQVAPLEPSPGWGQDLFFFKGGKNGLLPWPCRAACSGIVNN